MPKPAVYIETSVVSYATSRPSRDLITAARQALTREWFDLHAGRYELFVSQVVIAEASAGSPGPANDRTTFIRDFQVLEVSTESGELADVLVARHAVPAIAAEDALHIALAAVHGMDYLLTWNCKHIANAVRRLAIDKVCRRSGYEPPIICTPEELS